jgi:hypothetical protein
MFPGSSSFDASVSAAESDLREKEEQLVPDGPMLLDHLARAGHARELDELLAFALVDIFLATHFPDHILSYLHRPIPPIPLSPTLPASVTSKSLSAAAAAAGTRMFAAERQDSSAAAADGQESAAAGSVSNSVPSSAANSSDRKHSDRSKVDRCDLHEYDDSGETGVEQGSDEDVRVYGPTTLLAMMGTTAVRCAGCGKHAASRRDLVVCQVCALATTCRDCLATVHSDTFCIWASTHLERAILYHLARIPRTA